MSELRVTDGIWHRLDRQMSRLRRHRRPLSLALDGLVVVVCWNFTYLFRLGFERWWSARPSYDIGVMLGIAFLYLGVFALARIPNGMWRFSGFGEVKRLTLACLAAGTLGLAAVLLLGLREVPRAVLVLHPFVTIMGVFGVRVAYRVVYEHARARIANDDPQIRRAIVLGAGDAAKRLLAGIHHEGWTVLGLLDDDPAKRDGRIASIPVLGTLADLSRPEIRAGATHVIVAMPGASLDARRRAIDIAVGSGLAVMTVPSSSELQHGTARIERVRGVEPEDLLGRDPVVLDEDGIGDLLAGKTVLVTGAGGSIGSELCRQIARYGPSSLVLYELSESALYQVEQSLGEFHPAVPLVRLLGDVKNAEHLRTTFAAYRPQVVFHAAAFKHVPLMESENVAAALHNNALGTLRAATASAEAGVERFVLISTDKAVNPTSVMGASKRAAEKVLSHLAGVYRHTTFSAVRFGNVLGSSGSVIPKFKEQIARGGPVTVTHPDITRYFMTVSEAARLVLQAGAMAHSGEVHVLDMGAPVRIVQLAQDLIRLSGHRDGEIPIVFTGLRPGEKLHEELLADSERSLPTSHPRLRIARLDAVAPTDDIEQLLVAAASVTDPRMSRVLLKRLVPEFACDANLEVAAAPVDAEAASLTR